MTAIDYDEHDRMMEDDSVLKLIAMPLKILASKKIDAKGKMIISIVPDGERVQRTWDVNDDDVIRVPFPSSIFKGFELEQCYIFGFISHMHLVNENLEFETTLSKLSKYVGMGKTETYKHLNVLVQKGFMIKRIENKKLILSMTIPEEFDSFAEDYKGAKIIQMRENELLEILDGNDDTN